METQQCTAVRVMPEQEILRIAASLPVRSSCQLNWHGVEVHHYRLQPGAVREYTLPQVTVFIPHVTAPYRAEVFVAGRKMTGQIENGCISVAPPGLPIRGRCEKEHESTVIFLDPFTIAEAARAESGLDNLEIVPQFCVRDSLVKEIGAALDAQIASSPSGSTVYAESLTAALAAHLVANYANRAIRLRGGKLTSGQLRRSMEFMYENLHESLSLSDIAAVANMSRFHFAKSFRQATGITPYRYLVELRIKRARKLLALGGMSIEEIAYRVGYADKSHFTAQFHKVVGTTPHRYRHEI